MDIPDHLRLSLSCTQGKVSSPPFVSVAGCGRSLHGLAFALPQQAPLLRPSGHRLRTLSSSYSAPKL